MTNVTYNGINKSFKVPKKTVRLKKSVQLFFSSFLTVFFFAVCGILLSESITIGESLYTVNYSQIANTDFKVYLKENNHYTDSFLGPGYEYPTSLIENIEIDYNYLLMSEKEVLNFDYDYKVTARLTIANRNEANKILKDETFILKEESHTGVSSAVVSVEEQIDIDYDYYNEIVTSFKKDLSILVESALVVTLEVNAIGSSENIDNKINEKITRSILIPLNEQTIGIDEENSQVAAKGYISDLSTTRIDNLPLLIGSGLFGVAGIVFLVVVFITLSSINKKKDIYQKTIKKYLREYDRLIVTSKRPSINEESFENKIRVMSIEELVDAHDTTGHPIIYYEVVPNEKSYFVIVAGTTLYKLTISRNYLESQR